MHTLTDKSAKEPPRSGPQLHQDNYYHVVLSGNRRKTLFSTVDDRRALNVIATDTLQRFEGTLHAYCLMTNHFRALVQIESRSLIKALRQIATRYSHHRQRLKPAAHLFERPYVAQRIDTDGDFLNLLRAIHLTPVIANKVLAPADYLWSSHRAYLGYKSVTKVVTEFGLSLLAESPSQARVAYHHFIEQGMAEDFGRAKERKSMTKNDDSELNRVLTNTICIDAPPTLSDSRIQLPRFGRRRKHASSRRYLSVY